MPFNPEAPFSNTTPCAKLLVRQAFGRALMKLAKVEVCFARRRENGKTRSCNRWRWIFGFPSVRQVADAGVRRSLRRQLLHGYAGKPDAVPSRPLIRGDTARHNVSAICRS